MGSPHDYAKPSLRLAKRCVYCDVAMTDPPRRGGRLRPTDRTVDHIVPVSKGGTDALWNLVACCHGCNRDKADAILPGFVEGVSPGPTGRLRYPVGAFRTLAMGAMTHG